MEVVMPETGNTDVGPSKKLIFYAWSFDKGDEILLEKLAQILEEKSGCIINWEQKEIASYGEILHQAPAWGIAFGSMRGLTDPDGMITELPVIACLSPKRENKAFREGAMESIGMMAKAIINEVPKEEEPETKIYVETEEGHTVGKKHTDFIIDEETAEYARKIKDLVGGHAYMEKNGMRVEIK